MDAKFYYLDIKEIIQNEQGNILLLKHSKGYWDFPGGRTQSDEKPLHSLLREVKEETGLVDLDTIKPDAMILTSVEIPANDQSVGLILWYYTCNLKGAPSILLSDEHVGYAWMDAEEAKNLTKIDPKIAPSLFRKKVIAKSL